MKKYTAADIGQRPPMGAANYAGNQVAYFKKAIESGKPSGPNTLGEWLWPVEAEFFEQANRTRVSFSLHPHPLVLAQGQVA